MPGASWLKHRDTFRKKRAGKWPEGRHVVTGPGLSGYEQVGVLLSHASHLARRGRHDMNPSDPWCLSLARDVKEG